MKRNQVLCNMVVVGIPEGPQAEIVIMPAGTVQSSKGTFVMDADAWKSVAETFARRGNEIVVDYEHQSEGGTYTSPDGKAPAAGWIKALRFDPDRGVVATVEWTDKARDMIRAKEYKYLSPAFIVRKEDRRVVQFTSVGLTNLPAIEHMARVAASQREPVMSKSVKKLPDSESVKLAMTLVRAAAGGEEIDDESAALAAFGESLGVKADGEVKLAEAIVAKVKSMVPADKAATDKSGEVLAAIAKRVGVDKADADAICAKFDALQATSVPAAEYTALRSEVDALKADKLERTVDVMLDRFKTKINPHDAERVKWAREACRRSPADFEALMAGAPDVWEPGQRTPVEPIAADRRKTVIADSRREYRGTKFLGRMTDEDSYVNDALRGAGLPVLAKGESN